MWKKILNLIKEKNKNKKCGNSVIRYKWYIVKYIRLLNPIFIGLFWQFYFWNIYLEPFNIVASQLDTTEDEIVAEKST